MHARPAKQVLIKIPPVAAHNASTAANNATLHTPAQNVKMITTMSPVPTAASHVPSDVLHAPIAPNASNVKPIIHLLLGQLLGNV